MTPHASRGPERSESKVTIIPRGVFPTRLGRPGEPGRGGVSTAPGGSGFPLRPVICRPMAQAGCCVWFTGLSGAGKSTIADIVVAQLRERGRYVELLDGDEVREHLSKGLGFSKADRDTNVLRIGFVASLLARNGVVAVTAAISPYRDIRGEVRGWIDNFVEVHVATSLEDCEARDVKGLYAKARSGEIPEFTGVSDPYEAPDSPELVLETAGRTPEESAGEVLVWLEGHALL